MKRFQQIVGLFCMLGFSLISDAQIQHPPAGMRLCTSPLSGKKNPAASEQFKLNPSALRGESVNIAANWISLGEVTEAEVTQASLASDGTRLLVHYRQPNPGLNIDEGFVKEWTGTNWTLLQRLSNDCHNPDFAVQGNLIAASWNSDIDDYRFCSNANGPWVTLFGTYLQHQYGMTVAIAHNRSYMTFACRYSDGVAYPYMMLHIVSPVGIGPKITLDGGWRETFIDVGTDPAITGDDNTWYTVFRQGGYLYVMKGSLSGSPSIQDIGYGFNMTGYPYDPEIVILSGYPVVVWLEDNGRKIYIAIWDGTNWLLLGEATAQSGYFYSLRIATDGSHLVVANACSEGSPRISVSSLENGNWYNSFGILESNSSASIPTVDIAIHEGQPVVAFVENHVLKVMKSDRTGVETPAGSPITFRLSQNFPNPFNPVTRISFSLPETGFVTLKVCDLLGRKVAVLVNEVKTMGEHSVVWNPQGLANGIYLYQLQADGLTETKKLILQK